MNGCLAVIPARGGSKGILRKNLQNLDGIPLIAHTIRAAQNSELVTRVIVSTDDEEIAGIARSFGAEVPFVRPDELATDSASSVDVAVHALNFCENNESQYSLLVLLQPTSPFREAEDIDAVIKLLLDNKDTESVITVKKVANDCNPHYLYTHENDLWEPMISAENIMRRQELPRYYVRTGAVYAVRASYVKSKNRMIGERNFAYIMSDERSINIDSPLDLLIARAVVCQKSENQCK